MVHLSQENGSVISIKDYSKCVKMASRTGLFLYYKAYTVVTFRNVRFQRGSVPDFLVSNQCLIGEILTSRGFVGKIVKVRHFSCIKTNFISF